MRNYYVYWIEDEVAAHFYGRERLFFSLFQDHNNATNVLKQILHQQITYISKPLPYLPTHRFIQNSLQKRNLLFTKYHYTIEYPENKSGACLEIYERYFLIRSWGEYDAEAVFFDILKKFEGRLLAIDLDLERYGWIKPIKARKFV
ncbi:sporulation inhibitor of replication protein SirA [Bacillus sp. 2205SS5-2]|uniref:sporulation inhibitor of replication protein SirA n=1 Tax=Bacillus sp. 2205SS5-2 TaxID=3109031 RepID=UPI003005B977